MNEFVVKKGLIVQGGQSQITGSLKSSDTITAQGFTGSLFGTASYVLNGSSSSVSTVSASWASSSLSSSYMSSSAVFSKNILIFDGDSITDGPDSWPIALMNTPFVENSIIVTQSRWAVSSDGIGLDWQTGAPGTVESPRGKAISKLVINAIGGATASIYGFNYTKGVRVLQIKSPTVTSLNGRYTISTPVYASNTSSFTFPTSLGAQTITDATLYYGVVSRYLDLVRPMKPSKDQIGYYMVYIGINDQGTVYQGGTDAGLGWFTASMANLFSASRSDGFQNVIFTIHGQTSTYTNVGRTRHLMNNWIKTATDANGRFYWDYLIDMDEIVRNPYPTTVLVDGLHPTALTHRMIAERVSAVLRGGSNSNFVLSSGSFAGEIVAGGGVPEGIIIAPTGKLYTDNSVSTSSLYVKEEGTSSYGWKRVVTENTRSWNITSSLAITASYALSSNGQTPLTAVTRSTFEIPIADMEALDSGGIGNVGLAVVQGGYDFNAKRIWRFLSFPYSNGYTIFSSYTNRLPNNYVGALTHSFTYYDTGDEHTEQIPTSLKAYWNIELWAISSNYSSPTLVETKIITQSFSSVTTNSGSIFTTSSYFNDPNKYLNKSGSYILMLKRFNDLSTAPISDSGNGTNRTSSMGVISNRLEWYSN